MCQIIGMVGNSLDELIDVASHDSDFNNKIIKLLNIKGTGLKDSKVVITTEEKKSYEKVFISDDEDQITDFFIEIKNQNNNHVKYSLLWFSRMQPETEGDEPLFQQPIKLNSTLNNDKYSAIHGTLSNAFQVAEKNGWDINVDTDIMIYYTNLDLTDFFADIKGSYVRVDINDSSNNITIHNESGLGIYFHNTYEFSKELKSYNHVIFSMTRISHNDILNTSSSIVIENSGPMPKIINIQDFHQNIDEKIGFFNYVSDNNIFALYSGGMDITFTVAYLKKYYEGSKITGIYFDWGTAASEQEIKAGKRALMRGILDDYKIIDIKSFMQSIKNILNIDNFALEQGHISEGDHDARSNNQYVPSRNTYFTLLLSNFLEANYPNIHDYNIAVGANLSEAMTFNDNSAGWAERLADTISLSLKEKKNVSIMIPFVHKTKTEYLKEMLDYLGENEFKKVLDTCTSCYYPKEDGSPCGECGSCKLRNKALERIGFEG